MTWQINNVICYVCKVDLTTKFKLLKVYCITHVGRKIWNLCDPNTEEDMCETWRK